MGGSAGDGEGGGGGSSGGCDGGGGTEGGGSRGSWPPAKNPINSVTTPNRMAAAAKRMRIRSVWRIEDSACKMAAPIERRDPSPSPSSSASLSS